MRANVSGKSGSRGGLGKPGALWQTILSPGLLNLFFVCAAQAIPFVLPWNDSTPSTTDFSMLNPPVSTNRVVADTNGHFVVNGQRIRFLGVNLAFAAGMPAKEDGEKIAARLGKFGINVVRFHHLDTSAWPNGIRKRDAKDTGQLDPEALERLD